MIHVIRSTRYCLAAALLLAGGWLIWRWLPSGDRPTERQPGDPSAFGAVILSDTAALTGSLIFVEERGQPNYRIAQLDFATQTQRTVMAIPPDAFVYQIGLADDQRSILLTYSAPPAAGQVAYDRNGIYALDLTDGGLARLLGGEQAGVYYANPQRTRGALYYEVYQQGALTRRIERYDLASGRASVVAEAAAMPAVAPSGAEVAYFRINPQTQARSIWLAGALGGQEVQIVGENVFADLDLLLFAPDGRTLYFAVPEPNPAVETQSLLEAVFGASTASAHGNHEQPARWYRVALADGTPEPVTTEAVTALYASLSAGQIGFVNRSGFHLVGDRSSAQIVRSRTMRSFVWLP